MLQFSFRLLEFSSFFFAFAVSVNIATLIRLYHKLYAYGALLPSKENEHRIKNYGRKLIKRTSNELKYKDIMLVLAILMITSCVFIPHLHYSDNLEEEKLWPAVPVTASTGRVHAGCATFEYLPCKAFENRTYIENRASGIITLDGNVQIEECKKSETNLECKVITSQDSAIIELPYIYYLGYNVTLEQNGQKIDLENFETENGFVGTKLSNIENGIVRVSYTGTTLMKITRVISILALLVCFKMLTKPKK